MEVVAKFGEPTSKRGGGATEICLVYEHLGMEITL